MAITSMNKPYDQTPSKIRVLWETALQLIGEYEDFERRLTDIDTRVRALNSKLNSTINGNPNVQ
jgi:hypothetical protein